MITNLTQLEWDKTELKRIFYGQKKISGNFVNSRKRILNQLSGFYVSKTERRIPSVRFGPRVKHEIFQALFRKSASEGVSAILVR